MDGVRTPMAKAGTAFKDTSAEDLGAVVVREALARSGVPPRRGGRGGDGKRRAAAQRGQHCPGSSR